jgi:hypothetical protein
MGGKRRWGLEREENNLRSNFFNMMDIIQREPLKML